MFAELYSVYFSDFAVPATVAGTATKGIFDKAYQESFGIVAGDNPVLVVETSQVTAVDGDAVVVNATNYTIASIEPDGTGITILQLELAN
jgi:hypothetical protein